MSATVPQLGARALRELGVIVALDAERYSPGPPLTALDVAQRALRENGIVVLPDDRPDAQAPVPVSEIAATALRAEGVNPAASILLPSGVASPDEIASRALRGLSVNPAVSGAVLTGFAADRTAIGTKALLKLAVIASDETPTATDQAAAEAHVLSVHDLLASMEYVSWAVDAVPGQAVEHYVILAAQLMAPEFGRTGNLDAYNASMEALRVLSLSGPAAQSRAVVRVASVHDELVGAGIADWTLDNIPPGVADGYVSLVMQALAPTYGRPVDGNAYEAAVSKVRRLTLSGPRGQILAEARVRRVHDMLNAQGLAAWTFDAIPAAFADDYALMVGILLAPVMRGPQSPQDRQADAATWDAALERIRKALNVRDAQDRAILRVRQVHDEIAGLGLADWPVNAIPAAFADAYVTTVAAMLAEDTGKPLDPQVLGFGIERIRRLVIAGPEGQRLAEQKVRAVHASLDARGRVQWSLYDLPDYAEQPYVMMAAALLANAVGMKADPSWTVLAERDLMRIVSVPALRQPAPAVYF